MWPFVENEKADVVEEARVVAQGEIELLGGCDDDVALPDRVLVEAGDANAAVECRDRLSQRPEGPLQGGFRLRRKRPERRDEHHPPSAGQAEEDAKLGNPGLPALVGNETTRSSD